MNYSNVVIYHSSVFSTANVSRRVQSWNKKNHRNLFPLYFLITRMDSFFFQVQLKYIARNAICNYVTIIVTCRLNSHDLNELSSDDLLV